MALTALIALAALIMGGGAVGAALAARALAAAARERRQLWETIHDSEERFRTLADTAVDAVLTFDSRGTVTFANAAAERLLGYPEAELLGRDSAMLLPEFLRRVHREELAQYLATGVRNLTWQGVRLLVLDRNGKEVPVEATFTESRRGEERLFTAVARNLSPRRLAERRLREDRKRFEVLSEISRIALEDLEYRPMLQRICDTLARAFGWEFVAFISIVPDRGCFVCEALTTTRPTPIHVGYERELGDGVVGQVAATGKPILLDDVSGFPAYVPTLPGVCSELCVPVHHKGCDLAVLNIESTRLAAFHHQLPFLTKVAEQVAGALASARLYEEVRQRATLALVDGLTGIANRRQLDAELEREWRRGHRSDTPLSLVLLDIDGFKAFNDRYGHPAGDDCLRQVAAALADVPRRAADLVARYGGEELAIVLPELDAAGAQRIAEAARATVEALAIPHATSPAAPVVTVSAGVATRWPARGGSALALVAAADRALYLAKRQGCNRVQVAPSPPPDRPPHSTRLRRVGGPASG
ncbi:MAG TPA: diguanylate cyclase [Thermoanaerobaculia bacterium]|jgi:diguanylate cyclase (GGDEF)-like protein/PAS domain S-box-containing protein|nr:diguanylate cyclase [Thermoanaerobaculia bacterium]